MMPFGAAAKVIACVAVASPVTAKLCVTCGAAL